MSIEWQDLLAVPFLAGGDDPKIGLDCWGIAREIARRAGLYYPTMLEQSRARWDATTVLHDFECIGERWTALGAVGDLLIADPSRRGYASHVSVVVDAERALVLSTSAIHGPYCWHAHRVPCELGVFRLAK